MFENPRDILYIVISFCIIWVTVFLCWMFYYAARLLKNFNQIVEELRVRLQSLSDMINGLHSKVEGLSVLLTGALGGAGAIVKKYVGNRVQRWAERRGEDAGALAKEAVEKAVEATASGMKRMAKKIKK